jgi:hypothetical protein
MTENLKSEHGEAVNHDSLVAARRSREVEEQDGPRSRCQRLFWLLFWSQKSESFHFNFFLKVCNMF